MRFRFLPLRLRVRRWYQSPRGFGCFGRSASSSLVSRLALGPLEVAAVSRVCLFVRVRRDSAAVLINYVLKGQWKCRRKCDVGVVSPPRLGGGCPAFTRQGKRPVRPAPSIPPYGGRNGRAHSHPGTPKWGASLLWSTVSKIKYERWRFR